MKQLFRNKLFAPHGALAFSCGILFKGLALSLSMGLSSLFTFTACSDDDDDSTYPPVITELVEIHTNRDALVTEILSDDGTTYTSTQRIEASQPDTLFRCLCVYTKQENNRIEVYQLQRVSAPLPATPENFEELPVEPVKFISTWNTSRYLNLSCGILTTGVGTHALGFCDDGITEENGLQTAHVRLLHQRPKGDAESFTQKVFVCLPAFRYAGLADSIALTIPTYEGNRTLGFRF